MKRLFILLCVVLVFGTVDVATATLVGPVYPPPGGVTWSGEPDYYVGKAGGMDWNYSNFDLSQTSALYWGFYELPRLSMDGSGYSTPEVMSFSYLSADKKTAVWTGYSTLIYYNNSGYLTSSTVGTRLTLTSSVEMVLATELGFSYDVGALINVTGDYTANFLFESYFSSNVMGISTSGYYPYLDGYDAASTRIGVYPASYFNGGFYYEPVPEPATMLLLGSGLIGLAGLRRKKK